MILPILSALPRGPLLPLSLVMACGGGGVTFTPDGDCDAYLSVEAVGTLPGKADEVSGMVASARAEDVLWVVNDGDDLRLLAVNGVGEADTLAEVSLPSPGSTPDLEALTWGPCGTSRCIYIGDIGDNNDDRSSVHVMRLSEPDPFVDGEAGGVEIVTLTYEDGPRDAEAMVVSPSGDVLIFTKRRGGFDVYTAPFEAGATLGRVDVVDLSALGSEERVRAAALDPEDGRLLLRTDGYMIEYCLSEEADLFALSEASYHVIPSEAEPQGESVALDGAIYWHTSEGKGEAIYRATLLP